MICFEYEPEYDPPPMPQDYTDRETIKQTILNTFIIKDNSVLDFANPYYRDIKPRDVPLVKAIQRANRADLNPYQWPFYHCFNYNVSLWGDYHDDPYTADMPIFLTHVLRPTGISHCALSAYYEGKMYFIDSTMKDAIGIIPINQYQLLFIGG